MTLLSFGWFWLGCARFCECACRDDLTRLFISINYARTTISAEWLVVRVVHFIIRDSSGRMVPIGFGRAFPRVTMRQVVAPIRMPTDYTCHSISLDFRGAVIAMQAAAPHVAFPDGHASGSVSPYLSRSFPRIAVSHVPFAVDLVDNYAGF